MKRVMGSRMRGIDSAFKLSFNKYRPVSYALVPIAMAQLLLYMSTAKDNALLLGFFLFLYLFVGNYTSDAMYKLGLPILVTFVVSRYDILKQNMWEGLKNESDDAEEDKEEDEEEEDDDDDEEEAKEGGHDDAADTERDKKEKEEDEANGMRTKKRDVGREGYSSLGEIDKSLSGLNETLDTLEASYDRIMKMGSKLGIENQLSAMTKSLDITGILNQKKRL